MASFVARVLRSMSRRGAAGDEQTVLELFRLRKAVEEARDQAVKGLHDEQGWSWGEIALLLGQTRQYVAKRWGGE
jgi:hypothetical protein